MSENNLPEPTPTPTPTPPSEPSLPVSTSYTPMGTPPPAAPSGYSTRPLGVTILAVVSFIQGFVGICVACAVLGGSGILALVPTGVTQIIGGIGILGGLLLAAGPALYLLFAYGAWNLRPWAWLMGIIASGASVLGVLLGVLASGGAGIGAVLTNALIPIIILIYLLLPDTRKSFNM
jgi:hypothetical protein